MKKNLPQFFILVLFSFSFMSAWTQEDKKEEKKEERKAMMKDTLDGKFDFSNFLIHANGFVPVPMIITEPALGGFGGLLAAVFITPKKAPGYKGYVPPDITAAMGMYTVNNSWATGGFRMGSFPKAGIKYRAFAVYANMNIDFYRTLPTLGEKKFSFNIRAMPIGFSVSKKIIKKKEWYLGLSYAFTPTKLKPIFDGDLPEFVKPLDLDNNTAPLGLFSDYDTRNTIFTPDKGMRINIEYQMNDNWTGSDYEYQRLNGSLNLFLPVNPGWICGIRTEYQQAFNDAPFYLLPSINMRGVPTARYQGTTTMLMETEQRFDLNRRWSVLGFAGIGQAIEKNQSFSDGQTVYNVGTGFRYLLARVFKLRAGIDVAKGPDSWGYYIVFGHNWNR